jgi:hypothetical protein
MVARKSEEETLSIQPQLKEYNIINAIPYIRNIDCTRDVVSNSLNILIFLVGCVAEFA